MQDGSTTQLTVEDGTSILEVRGGRGRRGGSRKRKRKADAPSPEATRTPFFFRSNTSPYLFSHNQAGLDAGLDLPHDCKMGVCMKCSSRMVRNERELKL